MRGVVDGPTTQVLRLLVSHVPPVATVHHTVGVDAAGPDAEQVPGHARAVVVNVVQTRALTEVIEVMFQSYDKRFGDYLSSN